MELTLIIETLLARSKESKCCSRKVCAGIFIGNTFFTYTNKNLDPKKDSCEYRIYKCLVCGSERKHFHNCCDKPMLPIDKTFNSVIHAEEDLIANNDISRIQDKTIYITDFPCIRCSRLLISFGIKKIYYIRNFNDNEGKKLLEDNGIILIKLDTSNIRDEFKKLI